MNKIIFIVFVSICCFSCKKSSNANIKVKYEVQGSSADGYKISYTNELGQTAYTQANSGWTYEINGEAGECYKLTIIPSRFCQNSGTINIFFDNNLKATKSVTEFTQSVPDDQTGGMSCGITTTACN